MQVVVIANAFLLSAIHLAVNFDLIGAYQRGSQPVINFRVFDWSQLNDASLLEYQYLLWTNSTHSTVHP
jgi:hypothetical protein